MPMGEPKCGACGSDLISGAFHHCKPAWDEENAKLRAKIAQLSRFTECFVANPYEGTLECDITKPCPFCRYNSLSLKVDRYQKELETIAGEDPRYPDGDAMSDAMCAKIVLGRNCGFCGEPLPCRQHKEQQTKEGFHLAADGIRRVDECGQVKCETPGCNVWHDPEWSDGTPRYGCSAEGSTHEDDNRR
jgi:hypothetical protein